jgi:cell division protein FtsQ
MWERLPRPAVVANVCGRVLRRSTPAIVATLVLVVIGGGVAFGYRFVTGSSRFAIEQIDVRGTVRLDPEDIRSALPIGLGDNVFTADLDAATAALRAQPWIATAELRRVLPHTLVVELRERAAAAVVALDERYLVDADGHAFKRETGDGVGLPVITGLDRVAYALDPALAARSIVRAVAVHQRWHATATRPALDEVHLDARAGLTLQLAVTGIAVELGDVDGPALDARLAAFDAAWAALGSDERARLYTIHLDASDHVTVAFKD